jgi:hypothetical protein
MTFLRPIHPMIPHAGPIWQDGTFNKTSKDRQGFPDEHVDEVDE